MAYESDQKDKVDAFLWKGAIPYNQDLEEIFLYCRDFIWLEEPLFQKRIEAGDNWEEFAPIIMVGGDDMKRRIDGFGNEIIEFNNIHKHIISRLSFLLNGIDRESFLTKKPSKYFNNTYKVYQLIENIDWTISEARTALDNINLIKDEVEMYSNKLMVLRWVAQTLGNDYDRGITDLTEEEQRESIEEEVVEAKKDFDIYLKELTESV